MRHLLGIALPALVFMVQACTWMSEDQAEFWTQESVLKREEVQARLQSAVLINMSVCPDHYYAGLYAVDHVISAELNEPFYREDSVDLCVLGLLLTPCTPQAGTDLTIQSTLYRAVIRMCGPAKSGL